MFTLTDIQLKNAMATLDTTLRGLGLGALEAVHVLVGRFSNAKKVEDKDEFTVELSPEEVQAFLQACDAAVKYAGLQGAGPIVELANLFSASK